MLPNFLIPGVLPNAKLNLIARGQNNETPHILQKYLRADATVSERCSGAIPVNNSQESRNTRSNEAKKRVEDFDKIWAENEWHKRAAK
jgi:hypothetical protein